MTEWWHLFSFFTELNSHSIGLVSEFGSPEFFRICFFYSLIRSSICILIQYFFWWYQLIHVTSSVVLITFLSIKLYYPVSKLSKFLNSSRVSKLDEKFSFKNMLLLEISIQHVMTFVNLFSDMHHCFHNNVMMHHKVNLTRLLLFCFALWWFKSTCKSWRTC